jgi:hypothetical protein
MRLDEMLHGGEREDVAPAANPVSDQMSQIQAAFGTGRRGDR